MSLSFRSFPAAGFANHGSHGQVDFFHDGKTTSLGWPWPTIHQVQELPDNIFRNFSLTSAEFIRHY